VRITALEVNRGEADVRAAVENARSRRIAVERQRLMDEDVIPLRPCRHRIDIIESIWWQRDLPAGSARLVHRSPFEFAQHRALRCRPDIVPHVTCKTPEMREHSTPGPSASAGVR
jgi:hypothetical protein